ncbi:MAG: SBBP repeat-containing protein [Chitinophagales bacterium]|nr:SBBP repeat-containing protein [Chitinophagales bacterium]MDW8427208.1 SBBP repeat-containing protein [Chitinophagales bacterium]
MKYNYFFLMLVAVLSSLTGQARPNEEPTDAALIQSCFFIENKGQWPEEVLFFARYANLHVWITQRGAVLDFFELTGCETALEALPEESGETEGKTGMRKGHVIRLEFVNTSGAERAEGRQPLQTRVNYIQGKDPEGWVCDVRTYGEVYLANLYAGIGLRWYTQGSRLRFDLVLEAGADYRQIALQITGAERLWLEQNTIYLRTVVGDVQLCDMKVFRTEKPEGPALAARWAAGDHWLHLVMEEPPADEAITVDPLIYSTFVGGGVHDQGRAMTIDFDGNAYVTGVTTSPDFPTTTGAYQESLNANLDVFVFKLNKSGSALIYATYIGGSGDDHGMSVVVEGNSSVCVAGYTYSFDFPTTSGAWDSTFNGIVDAFVFKLNDDGSGLIYSTYLGGNNEDKAYAVQVDHTGYAYATGYTFSADFPVTAGALDQTFNGFYDVFVSIITEAGALHYSTYLGGSSSDIGEALVLDAEGHVYLTGWTFSMDYPTTAGAYDLSLNSLQDVFVTKFKPSTNTLVYSTYIGGIAPEYVRSIALDPDGQVYITGYTLSGDFPVTAGAYDETANGNWDVFVSKFNSSGSNLIYSTFLGDYGVDWAYSVYADAEGHALITGHTSGPFPTTAGAFDESYNGDWDAFICQLSPLGNSLQYSTYLGGSLGDFAYGLKAEGTTAVVVAGYSASADYPTTAGAFQPVWNAQSDVVVTKLSWDLPTQAADDMFLAQLWRVWPIPAKKCFYIEVQSSEAIEIALLDVYGRIQERYVLEAGIHELKPDVAGGVYLLWDTAHGRTCRIVLD